MRLRTWRQVVRLDDDLWQARPVIWRDGESIAAYQPSRDLVDDTPHLVEVDPHRRTVDQQIVFHCIVRQHDDNGFIVESRHEPDRIRHENERGTCLRVQNRACEVDLDVLQSFSVHGFPCYRQIPGEIRPLVHEERRQHAMVRGNR